MERSEIWVYEYSSLARGFEVAIRLSRRVYKI